MFQNFFSTLEANPTVVALGQMGFLYNVCSVLHYFCVFVMVGSMTMVDLRVLGVASRRATIQETANQLLPWMWTAFTIAMITGIVEFLPNGGDFSGSHQFQLKTLFIILSVFFAILVQAGVKGWSQEPEVPGIGKVLAVLSILCFLLSLLFALNVAAIDGLG